LGRENIEKKKIHIFLAGIDDFFLSTDSAWKKMGGIAKFYKR